MRDVRRLLEELEKVPAPGVPCVGPRLPESLLGVVASLRGRLDEPPAAVRLDAPLEAETAPVAPLEQRTAVPSDVSSADDLMEQLDEVAEDSDEALLEVARRLKRARHAVAARPAAAGRT